MSKEQQDRIKFIINNLNRKIEKYKNDPDKAELIERAKVWIEKAEMALEGVRFRDGSDD